MGEENRGSSESSTVLIVVAILGGILLVGCLGGLVVVGAGLLWVRAEADVVQPPPVRVMDTPVMAMPKTPDAMAPEPAPPEKLPSERGKPEEAPTIVPGDEKQE